MTEKTWEQIMEEFSKEQDKKKEVKPEDKRNTAKEQRAQIPTVWEKRRKD